MEIRMMIIVIHGFLLLSCGENRLNNQSEISQFDMIQIDSIIFTRVGKSGWIERDYFPKEKMSITLDDGKISLSRDSSTVFWGSLEKHELDTIKSMLFKIENAQINRIYNAEQIWLTDMEFYAYCKPIEKSFMIKSFGNFDEVPPNIQDLNSFLLRKMRNSFSSLR